MLKFFIVAFYKKSVTVYRTNVVYVRTFTKKVSSLAELLMRFTQPPKLGTPTELNKTHTNKGETGMGKLFKEVFFANEC